MKFYLSFALIFISLLIYTGVSIFPVEVRTEETHVINFTWVCETEYVNTPSKYGHLLAVEHCDLLPE